MTYLEKRRKEAQYFYVKEQQYLEESKPLLEKSRQEDMDRMRESAGSLLGWLENMTGKPPGKPAEAKPAVDPLNPAASVTATSSPIAHTTPQIKS